MAVIFVLIWLAACTTLPDEPPARAPTSALAPAETGRLAEVAAGLEAADSDESHMLPIIASKDALQWRLALADTAEQSIDAMYFSWYSDPSGALLYDRIERAAERGLRVRLLVDDVELFGEAEGAALADLHPNVEVRIFNPWKIRGNVFAKAAGFLSSPEVNRRMHNKALIADNHFAIVGGRNIGDKYFGIDPVYNFRDLDVLMAGPVVPEISHVFDLYWNSDWAYPADLFATDDTTVERYRQELAESREQLAQEERLLLITQTEPAEWDGWWARLAEGMSTGRAYVAYDDPPASGEVEEFRLIEKEADFFDLAQEELLVASAYFIPSEEDFAEFERLIDRGVRVVVLTAALESNDWTISNSAYKKYRKGLVDTGVELYEYRADAVDMRADQQVPSGFTALHTKAFVVDREKVFIGSLNLDPRGVNINTEMGVIIESPVAAARIAAVIERDLEPDNSWRVKLGDEGKPIWTSSAGTVDRQPARGSWQRFLDGFYSLLPLEDQL